MKQAIRIQDEQVAILREMAPAQVDTPVLVRTSHSGFTIILHWSTVAAILVAVAAVLVRELIEDDAWRVPLMNIHRQAGLFVLVALALRLAVRFTLGLLDVAHDMPRMLRLAAAGAHAALYAMLLALPLLGWATTSAHGVGLKLFGLMRLPALVRQDSDLADVLDDWHVWSAWGLLALVAMHVVAACWHHYVRRDRVLAAMLPLVRPRRGLGARAPGR